MTAISVREKTTETLINAGHNPPLPVRADGSNQLLDEGGIPLGVFDDTQYSEFFVDLRAGWADIILRFAARSGANLIVLPANGSGLIPGSHQVVEQALCDVIVAR